jgi:hypothetical protein
MRKLRVIEHISLDGVIRANIYRDFPEHRRMTGATVARGGASEKADCDVAAVLMGDGECRVLMPRAMHRMPRHPVVQNHSRA